MIVRMVTRLFLAVIVAVVVFGTFGTNSFATDKANAIGAIQGAGSGQTVCRTN